MIVEPIVGHVDRTTGYGQSTGLSPVAVIASATFWTWLWGPIGLILATPLTMCLVVLGRHVDRLKFLEVMFGDQPPLTPAELIYQRMLARDPVEAAEQARIFLKEKPLISYYDDILLEGLKLAQADAERNLLDDERMQRIRDGVAEIVDDLAPHEDKAESRRKDDAAVEDSPLAQLEKVEDSQRSKRAAGAMADRETGFVHSRSGPARRSRRNGRRSALEREGIGARAEPAGALSMAQIFSWDTKDVALVCLCYIENVTPAQIRYAVRRIRRRAPDVFIIVALLAGAGGVEGKDLSANTDLVQDSLRSVIDKILELAHGPPRMEASAECATAALG